MMKNALLFIFLASFGFTVWADPAMLIDVRTDAEYYDGHATGASNIPYESVAYELEKQGISKDTPIYLYCRSGRRATYAKGFLEQAGYSSVTNLGSLGEAEAFLEKNPL
ncbi:MAG: rhodanese-like domain-containing protein [Oceanobacter sp.]